MDFGIGREDVIAHAQVQREPRTGAPIVLDVAARLPTTETFLNERVVARLAAAQAFEEVAHRLASEGAVEVELALRGVALSDSGTPADKAEPEANAVRALIPGEGPKYCEAGIPISERDESRVTDCRIARAAIQISRRYVHETRRADDRRAVGVVDASCGVARNAKLVRNFGPLVGWEREGSDSASRRPSSSESGLG